MSSFTATSSTSFCRIVLLAKGRGTDAASFCPNRDESQWWNRRDALVRCIAASSLSDTKRNVGVHELVIIMDEDYSRFIFTRTNSSHARTHDRHIESTMGSYPSEQRVVAMMKRASSQPGAVQVDPALGLNCLLVISSKEQQHDHDNHHHCLPASIMESKRNFLQHIQSHCSMDFLKEHRLNASAQVVLRKTNKETLKKVWWAWTKASQTATSGRDKRGTTGTTESEKKCDTLGEIFRQLLQPQYKGLQVIAGLLHESSDSELPCWDSSTHNNQKESSRNETSLQSVLFLGAVRDMHPWENQLLQRICRSSNVPLTNIRLGPVPEFTSKILTVVAYHASHGRLHPAMTVLTQQQLQQNQELSSLARKRGRDGNVEEARTESCSMSVICFVPHPSSKVTTKLSDRSHILWCLVRVVVVTLWRSRLAQSCSAGSTKDNCHPNPLLLLIFDDKVLITLSQKSLVTGMATNHQAAPSEYQILHYIIKAIQQSTPASNSSTIEESLTSLITRDTDVVIECTTIRPTNNATQHSHDDDKSSNTIPMSDRVYAVSTGSEGSNKPNTTQKMVAVLHIGMSKDDDSNSSTENIRRLSKKYSIPCFRKVFVVDGVDAEAGSITMLQHFMYQNQLLNALNAFKKSERTRPRH